MTTKRILVIDDEEAIQEVLRGCLEELANWQVFTASSSLEGMEIARSERPEGILLDVSLPDVDGLEMLTNLKADPQLWEIPVVLLTARVQLEDQRQFATLPIAGVIAKPFDPLTLVYQITAAFGWNPA
jgi:CheY-like chemotaxis protein